MFWKQAGKDGTYGCMYADGSGIVYGGVTPDDKKTCDTFKKASFPSPKLPTRGEAAKSGQ